MLIVAMELLMSLFALLYAYPHVPTTLLRPEVPATTSAPGVNAVPAPAPPIPEWFGVTSPGALRTALQAMLQTSEALGVSLRPGQTPDDITLAALADPFVLSTLFDLDLYGRDTPVTSRQMFEALSAAYRAMLGVNVYSRNDLFTLFRRHQLLPLGHLPTTVSRFLRSFPGTPDPTGGTATAEGLLRFCTELTTAWLQPYFAHSPDFYLPRLIQTGECQVGA
jgi:hypothetical protein